MKKYKKIVLVGAVSLLFNNAVFASENAVKINIGSSGAGDVSLTIASVRQIMGHALGSGVIDDFIVTVPQEGEPIPVEGGLSACAQAGFGIVADDSQEDPRPENPEIDPDDELVSIVPKINSGNKPPPELPEDDFPEELPGFDGSNKFDVLVKQLQSIQPDEGIFLNIELAESCGISVETEEDEDTDEPVSVEKKMGVYKYEWKRR